MQENPKISLLHPTARVVSSDAFPDGWRAAYLQFMATCDVPEQVEYIIAVHESRWDAFWSSPLSDLLHDTRVRVVKNKGRDCVVDQVNTAAEHATGGLFLGVQDDLRAPEHWDTLLLDAAGGVEGEVIVIASSGATPERDRELMICGAVSLSRYRRYGFVLDPEFESMFSDNWFALCALRDQRDGIATIVERFDIQFQHLHPSFGLGVVDEIYQLQNRPMAYKQGAATFHKKASGCKMMVACLPGENFRNSWVASTFQMLQDVNGAGIMCGPCWSYTTNVYCTRMELATAALEFKPKPDYVLWVDDDNLVNGSQVLQLVRDLEENPELGGVVGWCWCDHDERDGRRVESWRMSVGRQRPGDLQCKTFTPEDIQRAYSVAPLITSDDVAPDALWSGFPCVLMRLSVLESLGAAAFAPLIIPEVNYGFTGEDTSFFINAHKAGIKFAVDLRVKVPHVKWKALEPHVNLETRCTAFCSPGPPMFAAQCKHPAGHAGKHDFGSAEEAEKAFYAGSVLSKASAAD